MRLITFVLLLFSSILVSAQTKVVGKVTDEKSGNPVIGASVSVKGTTIGTVTDIDGQYEIMANNGDVLVISYVGMNDYEYIVGSGASTLINLQEKSLNLDEVVVTGYGGSLSKKQVTGSISKVKSDEIENLPVQSFDRALQGRISGVQVTSANGIPGGAVQVRIRGVGSISGSLDPLYIVDGVPLNSTNRSLFTSSNPLNFLNPNDIESIEILKDASTTSIYGSQAANGVILVTTKKGKAGKTKIDFNYYKGWVSPPNKLEVLNTQDWIRTRTDAVKNAAPGTTDAAALTSVLTGIRLPGNLTQAQIDSLPTYDWQDEAFQLGQMDNYELALSGGNDKTKFYWSGGLNKADANLVNADFWRGSTALRLSQEVTKRLYIETSVNLGVTKSNGQFGGPSGGSFLGASAFSSSLMLPHNPIYNADGSYYGTPADGGTAGILNQNIIMVSKLNEISSKVLSTVGNINAVYKITDYWKFKPFFGIDYSNITGRNYQDPRTPDGFNVKGRLQLDFNENTNYTTGAVLNYNRLFNQIHNFDALVGYEYRKEANEFSYAWIEGFPSPDFKYPSQGASPQSITGGWAGYAKQALLSQVKYGFNSKYFLTGTLRYDGSSRFGRNNRYGLFPGVSAAWVLSEESFIKNIPFISDLKLRAGWGITGRDQLANGNYFPSLGLYSAAAYNNNGGIVISTLSNPDLVWEKTTEVNVGLEFGILNNKMRGQIDVFDRKSTDLLLELGVPQTSGFNTISSNVGELSNRGVEVELGVNWYRSKSFSWVTDFNYTGIQNKVLKLYDGITKIANRDSFTILPGNTSIIVGKPIGAVFTSEYAGVNPATGRGMWYDENGNITYNPRNPGDFKYHGSNIPKFFGGLTNSFTFFRDLELIAGFQYEFGRKAINNQGTFLSENGGRLFNVLQDVYDRRWVKPGDITDVPRSYNGNAETRGVSNLSGTRLLEDASYIRLKTLTLSYNFCRKNFIKKIESMKVYATAFNIHTWTKWSGYDPEWINFGNGNNGVVPLSKSFIVGAQIVF
ncbi:MAG: TonB-dependent receptor [Saprospiraceae bacterium]